jgi:anti-sigma regulatory factor (Ser/Thr protein kinase)
VIHATVSRSERLTGYRHEALIWDGIDDFVARTAPFVADGVGEGTPVMVAVPAAHWEPLREALGPIADEVHFADMAVLGHNPARIIPAWVRFIEENGGGSRPLRGIGEPIWSGRREQELVECQIHEALLNLAVPASTPLWLLCPYDAGTLDAGVLEEAARSHPVLQEDSGTQVSTTYGGHHHPLNLATQPLPEPEAEAEELAFSSGDLPAVRRLVERHVRAAGLERHRLSDLVLGVNEVAANSLDHGGGGGTLRAWHEAGALVFEVRDAGQITDPLVGRLTPAPAQPRGRGLWMVNRLCDLMQIRSVPGGTAIRVVTWL